MTCLRRTIIILAIMTLLLSAIAFAGGPPQMSYQGFLTDAAGDPVADGPHLIQFRIWDAETGGTTQWDSGYRTINVTDGLFSYHLGDTVAIDPAIFQASPDLWVGVKVGADPEILPRTKLTSVGYAFEAGHAASSDWSTITNMPAGFADGTDAAGDHDIAYADASYVNVAGDVMTGSLSTPELNLGTGNSANGSLNLYSSSETLPVVTAGPNGSGGRLRIAGQNGRNYILLDTDASTNNGGYIAVARNSSNYYGFTVDGNYNNTEEPYVAITGSTQGAYFNMSLTGDATVALPDDAINSAEMLNEPGIAASQNTTPITLVQGSGTMVDIETVTITIPATGYIIVRADLVGYTYGTIFRNYGLSQIDETAGGGYQLVQWRVWGTYISVSSGQWHYASIPHNRVYFKSAGTYTFRLEAMADPNNDPSANTMVQGAWMTATYYPTSYGTVETIVASPDGFDNPQLVTSEDLDGNAITGYKVDLRDLEIRATKARLEAERLDRELADARSKNLNETADIK